MVSFPTSKINLLDKINLGYIIKKSLSTILQRYRKNVFLLACAIKKFVLHAFAGGAENFALQGQD